MKNIFFFILLLLFSKESFSQGRIWTEWETIYEEGVAPNNHKVEISFSYSTNVRLSNPSYWRIRNNFTRPKVYCQFSFDYVAFNNQIKNQLVIYEMIRPEVHQYQGDYFMGAEVRKVNLPVKINDYGKSKTKGVSEPDLDDIKLDFDLTFNSYGNKLLRIDNEEIKQQYQNALNNSKKQFTQGYQLAKQYNQQGNNAKMQEQLAYLEKVKKQMKDNYNLLNDIVERPIVISGVATKKTTTVNTTSRSTTTSIPQRNTTVQEMERTREFANNSIGLNNQQIKASEKIGENVGVLLSSIIRSGSDRREREYERKAEIDSRLASEANKGDIEAMIRLAIREEYRNKDLLSAFIWREKAARLGNLECIRYIYYSYRLGRHGKNKDEEKAKEWKEKGKQIILATLKENCEIKSLAEFDTLDLKNAKNDVYDSWDINMNDLEYRLFIKQGAELGSIKANFILGQYLQKSDFIESNRILKRADSLINQPKSISDLSSQINSKKEVVIVQDDLKDDIYFAIAQNYDGTFFKDRSDSKLATEWYSKALDTKMYYLDKVKFEYNYEKQRLKREIKQIRIKLKK